MIRAAAAGAALGAGAAGLLGAPAGLVLIVGGVWAARTLEGRPPGTVWALACLGLGIRWGSATLSDVHAAGRLLGSAVVVEPAFAAGASVVLVLAAVLDEARLGGFRDPSPLQKAASGVAALTLVSLVAPPGGLLSVSVWAAASAGLAVVWLTAPDALSRVPGWPPVALTSAAVVVLGAYPS